LKREVVEVVVQKRGDSSTSSRSRRREKREERSLRTATMVSNR
jgi:hypothetical protein